MPARIIRWRCGHDTVATVHIVHMLEVLVIELHVGIQVIQQLRGFLQRRGWLILHGRYLLLRLIDVRGRCTVFFMARVAERSSNLAVSSLPCVDCVEVVHNVLHYVFVVHHSLLYADQLLDQHLILQKDFIEPLCELLELLLGCY